METAFLVRPGGRSESPHPPRPAIKRPAASARTSRPRREIMRLESNIGHPAEPGVGSIVISMECQQGKVPPALKCGGFHAGNESRMLRCPYKHPGSRTDVPSPDEVRMRAMPARATLEFALALAVG